MAVFVQQRELAVVLGRVGPDHSVGSDLRAGRVERCLVGTLVEHLRLRVLFGRTHSNVFPPDELADGILRVVEVHNFDCFGRAHDHTRRCEINLDPVVAEVALLGGVCFRVDVQRVVGARVHARFAADAVVVLEVHHTVVGTEQSVRRADRHTGRVFAMLAGLGRKTRAT